MASGGTFKVVVRGFHTLERGTICGGKFVLCKQCGMIQCGDCVGSHQYKCDKRHKKEDLKKRVKILEDTVKLLQEQLNQGK